MFHFYIYYWGSFLQLEMLMKADKAGNTRMSLDTFKGFVINFIQLFYLNYIGSLFLFWLFNFLLLRKKQGYYATWKGGRSRPSSVQRRIGSRTRCKGLKVVLFLRTCVVLWRGCCGTLKNWIEKGMQRFESSTICKYMCGTLKRVMC